MTMNDELERMVRELHDRQAIRDQINNYCRGVDRMDRSLLLSVYHPDAIDDHGLFVGGPEAFADWAFGYHGTMQSAHQHIVTNHTCELDGDTAHTETYWLFAGVNKDGSPATIGGGRYIDRFEKRNGNWRIAARKGEPAEFGKNRTLRFSGHS
jgi:ketosteroid isomerase-like protein